LLLEVTRVRDLPEPDPEQLLERVRHGDLNNQQPLLFRHDKRLRNLPDLPEEAL
jgi:hypothetical protein